MKISRIYAAAGVSLLGLIGGAAQAQDCTITIGRIAPVTGAFADAGKDTPWIDGFKQKTVNDAGGLKVGDRTCMISVKSYDGKSTVAGAAEAANQAILRDKVDFLIATGGPETTTAPSDICERNKVACVIGGTPVEAWLYGADGKPKSYDYAYEFFFSVVDLVKNHIGMIDSLPGGFNGKIGYLYPNDSDGTVFASMFTPAITEKGWEPVDPGRFPQGLPDFSSVINQFKRNRVEVVTGVLTPPDMQNFLQQAAQAGFKPKMYIIDKGTGYPEPMAAIGEVGYGLLSVNFWSPAFPGSSKYGKYDGQGLVDAFESATGKKYMPPLAYNDAGYDVLFDAIERAGSLKAEDVTAALSQTDLETVVGTVNFNENHISVQPLGGAQWRYDEKLGDIVKESVFNEVYPSVAKTAEMQLYGN